MEAKQGHIDNELSVDREKVFGLLNETIPSSEPQQEAYRVLLVSVCNDYNKIMPFLFEKIADYTELLMPDDLLSDSSVLTLTRNALSDENCENVEVIGWLYQFYISEKKDEVFAGLKENKKVTPENIPAATQLFTPNWIVRYLVENSLGRLWMLNNPNSKLINKMEYYIKPEQEEIDFLKIRSPEEIKICDPACGSGHMLVYAFEILYLIYEEEGYDAPEIPNLILINNLYGIEIDERAGELSAFALFMKARQKYRRFFRKPVQPNICVFENINFEKNEVKSYMDKVGHDLLTMNFQTLLYDFKEANNFGSLIRPSLTDIKHIYSLLDEKKVADDLFLPGTHKKVLKVLKQASYLSPKYHVVIANPPYMSRGGMNGRLGKWVLDNYPDSKADLFSIFIERNLNLVLGKGIVAMITMQNWMFLSSFEKLRNNILSEYTIFSMAHLGSRSFDSIGGEIVSTTAFTLHKRNLPNYKGSYLRLIDGLSEEKKKNAMLDAIKDSSCECFYRTSAVDFKKISHAPLAYWLTDVVRDLFAKLSPISELVDFKQGLATCNNELFLRQWHEVSIRNSNIFAHSLDDSMDTRKYRWFPFIKGGENKKWYGNYNTLVNWHDKGKDIHDYNDLPMDYNGAPLRAKKYYFKKGLNWSSITSSFFAVRYTPPSSIFGTGGSSGFSKNISIFEIISLLNSKTSGYLMKALSMTLNIEVGQVSSLPYIKSDGKVIENSKSAIAIAKDNYDSYETSWNFTNTPLLKLNSLKAEKHNQKQIATSNFPVHQFLKIIYQKLRVNWREIISEMQELEEENNKIYIAAYGLKDELSSNVSLPEITLSCNPNYRYPDSSQKAYTSEEREKLLLTDTIKEFISYSVGCMFGRYSLDKPGLILANQGETIEDYLAKILEPTFEPDDDNVIPIMDVDWFSDDIVERFKKFLKIAFGEENYAENLAFIEDAIGKDIRKYFLKDFYDYHVKMYKKRPIYWMFSSPKGSFNTLIYMHRYRQDTVSIVLNDYLREFKTKLSSRKGNLENISISTSASQSEKTKALKEIEKIRQNLDELDEYERDILYPLATQQIEIDLDDGVKVNYPKFGRALKKITGL